MSLAPGWTEHVSPTGRAYYYNAATGTSTYKRPHVKREKPVAKTAVPNTDGWLRVRTNHDNTFYFHPPSKQSQWLIPPQIADAVKQLHAAEAREEAERQKLLEQEQKLARDRQRAERAELKRKAEEGVPITEFESGVENGKRARIDEDEDEDADPPENAIAGPEKGEEDDAEWQRQVAEEMAAEAEQSAEEADPIPPPEVVAQDLETLKAAFYADLTSLNGTPNEVNPMAPWDLELSKFAHQPSFSHLPAKEREEAFNHWCKLRIREKRAAKATSSTQSTPEDNYQRLLREEVRSTRTKWDDFRSAFKRDARFRYFASDKEREKLFHAHLVQLGEEKRVAAERASEAFLDLLSDTLPGHFRNKVAAAKAGAGEKAVASVWLDAKQTPGLTEDKRYDQVGSSTRRLELFQVWARGEKRVLPPKPQAVSKEVAPSKHEAAQKALRKREEKVRQERERVMRQNRAAFGQATRQESTLAFQQLLVDSIRDAQMDKHAAMRQMARDTRFDAPGLSDGDKEKLLDEHMARLNEKQQSKLDNIFRRHARSLDTHQDDVLALTMQDDELDHGALRHYRNDREAVEEEYQRWNRQRQHQAQLDFMQMLHESAFVDFWGRFKNSASVRDKTADGDSDDDDGGALLDMAAKVDLNEIQSILRNDARFRAFQHNPQQREEWIRDHLANLAAPAKSFHR